ncbi:MAG: FGGY-family carbohydrate kinase, partial [Anaerococcus obesiensis]
MAEKYFLGVDIGTNESKGVIIDKNGDVIASTFTSHGVENPKPNYFEHDADEIWYKDLCIISNKLLKETGIDPKEIKGVGCSALSSDCLPVDKDGKPLRKAILYGIDARAMEECKILTEKWGEEKVIELFGRPLGSSDIAPKILWIKRNEPEVFEKTYKFLTASSYLAYKLTGNYTVDRFLGLASFNPLYNNDGSPNESYCDGICKPDQLADVMWTTDISGYVTEKASRDTGLAVGTPVIAGGDDSGAEAISSGVMTPGDMLIQMGSTVYMILCTEKLYNDDRLWREAFIIPNTFDISAGTNTSGALTKWIRDVYYKDKVEEEKNGGENAYQAIMNDIKDIPIGSNGIVTLPYFAGERTPINDSKAKGLVIGLDLTHD